MSFSRLFFNNSVYSYWPFLSFFPTCSLFSFLFLIPSFIHTFCISFFFSTLVFFYPVIHTFAHFLLFFLFSLYFCHSVSHTIAHNSFFFLSPCFFTSVIHTFTHISFPFFSCFLLSHSYFHSFFYFLYSFSLFCLSVIHTSTQFSFPFFLLPCRSYLIYSTPRFSIYDKNGSSETLVNAIQTLVVLPLTLGHPNTLPLVEIKQRAAH